MTQKTFREQIASFSDVVLALSAIVLVAIAVADRNGSGKNTGTAAPEMNQPDWLQYANKGKRVGSTDSGTLMIVFSDYQCPYCAIMEGRLEKARKMYPQFQVLYRHFPLSAIHKSAYHAAIASECAARQGHFAEMHSQLFRYQDSLGLKSWPEIAVSAGVSDLEQFSVCMVDPSVASLVDEDLKAARELGLSGTPVLLINGKRIEGAIKEDRLFALIEDEQDNR